MEGDLTHITSEKLDLTANFKSYRDITTKKLEERELALNTFKAELRQTQAQLYHMREELERTQGQMQRSMKESQDQKHEIEKMRQRLALMRQSRGNMGLSKMNSKYCKNCLREYTESENLNWSCRIHRGEWGGDLWWCCGKTNRNA